MPKLIEYESPKRRPSAAETRMDKYEDTADPFGLINHESDRDEDFVGPPQSATAPRERQNRINADLKESRDKRRNGD